MNKKQITHMVDRFLMWRLPENFSPDAGISFKPTFNDHMDPPMRHNPVGTNLFDAMQAEAMVRHITEGLPGSSVVDEIAAERQRQIEVEGWSLNHDDEYNEGALAQAAACYAVDNRQFNTAAPPQWPWSQRWWKPSDRRRNLVKSAALIVAEIERLDRAKQRGEL